MKEVRGERRKARERREVREERGKRKHKETELLEQRIQFKQCLKHTLKSYACMCDCLSPTNNRPFVLSTRQQRALLIIPGNFRTCVPLCGVVVWQMLFLLSPSLFLSYPFLSPLSPLSSPPPLPYPYVHFTHSTSGSSIINTIAATAAVTTFNRAESCPNCVGVFAGLWKKTKKNKNKKCKKYLSTGENCTKSKV